MTPLEYDAVRRALGVKGPVTLAPAPTNVVDLKSRRAYHPPGSLARSLQNIADAFPLASSDG